MWFHNTINQNVTDLKIWPITIYKLQEITFDQMCDNDVLWCYRDVLTKIYFFPDVRRHVCLVETNKCDVIMIRLSSFPLTVNHIAVAHAHFQRLHKFCPKLFRDNFTELNFP